MLPDSKSIFYTLEKSAVKIPYTPPRYNNQGRIQYM